MNLSASGNRAAAVGKMTGGTVITGDVNILVQGINALYTDFATRIKSFLVEYLGTPAHPVPFGGREEYLNLLDAWLDGERQPSYLLLTAPAGRGKSALLARWSQRLLTRADVAVVFVPVSIRFRTNLASVVFPAVTARLAALHGESLTVDAGTHVEVWRGMMSDYIARPLASGQRLLLVLDGVDEAADWVVGPDIFPAVPPEGVRIVVSARLRAGELDAGPWLDSLGWSLRGLGSSLELGKLNRDGVEDVLIQMGSPLDELSNRADIVAALHRLSEGDPLVVRLYVDDLWKRKTGQQLSPEHLETSPPGLKGYLDQWWRQQELLWDIRQDNPLERPLIRLLLKLFAFTVAPLTQRDLLNLATMALPQVRTDSILLKAAMRPLNRLVLGDGKEQGYVFSHPRLAVHFAEEYECERAGIESLLLSWGRQELAALNAGSLPPAKASAYLVQYYGVHLDRASQHPDDLLELVSDGWRLAWKALEGGHWGFMSDVSRAWRAVTQSNTAEADSGERVMRLGAEVRCALCKSSVRSSAGNLPPVFVIEAVERGLWQVGQALGYSRLMPESNDRIQVVTSVASRLQEAHRQQILEEALAEARAIPNVVDKAKALADLAPHLPETLLRLDMEEALAAAKASHEQFYVLWVLEAMAPHLSEPLLEKAFRVARDIVDEYERSNAIKSLSYHLPGPLLEEVLAAARDIEKDYYRAELLTALAPQLPSPQRRPILEQALAAARSSKTLFSMTRILPDLAAQLPERSRGQVLEEALAWARSVEGRFSKIEGLTNLAPQLPERLRDEVLEEAVADLFKALEERSYWHDEDEISSHLVRLAAMVPEQLLENILAIARNLEEDFWRAQALTACLLRLPEPRQRPVFEEALATARAVQPNHFENVKPGLLLELAKTVSGSLRDEIMLEALTAANGIWDEAYHRRVALEELATYLSEPLLLRALSDLPTIRDEGERYALLATLAPHHSQAQQTLDAALEQALDATRAITNKDDRVRVMADLAPYLPKPQTGLAFIALEDTLATAWEMDNLEMSDFLATLAPHLPEVLVREAVETARDIADDQQRAMALAALVPHMPDDCREPILEEVLMAVENIRSAYDTSKILLALTPYLCGPLLEEALDAALDIGEGFYSSKAVAAVALRLPEAVRRPVLEEVIAMVQSNSDAGLALSPLAPYLRRPLLEETLAAVPDIKNLHDRSEALTSLAPHVHGPLLEQALVAAREIDNPYIRAKTLAALAPYLAEALREPILEEALKAALKADSQTPDALETLAPQLSTLAVRKLYSLWREALSDCANGRRNDLLADLRALSPVTLRLGGQKAMADIFEATADVGRWWS